METSTDLAFGVGSFRFPFKQMPSEGLLIHDYLELLKDTLEAVPNVEWVRYETGSGPDDALAVEEFEEDELELGFFPLGLVTTLDFRIHIPRRVQNELLTQRWFSADSLEAEDFDISIQDGFASPITFVRPVGASRNSDPSQAVVVVRKFLEDQIDQLDTPLMFKILGPSPFHADCFLAANTDPSRGVDVDFLATSSPIFGYAKLQFEYNTARFRNLEEAWDALRFELRAEFDLYYEIAHETQRRLVAWDRFEGDLDELVRLHTDTGLTAWVSRFVRVPTHLDTTIMTLARYESNAITSASHIADRMRSIYNSGRAVYLKLFAEEELARMADAPTAQAERILNLFESRRSKRVDSVLVLVSSIVGGAIGSVLTLVST